MNRELRISPDGVTLDHLRDADYSPYKFFTAEEWAQFRADTPLTLSAGEVTRLRSLNDPIDLDEVRRIYLSLSRLLSAHVESSQILFAQRKQFLNLANDQKTPFVIGIAGSVAVGKSTTARILKELLSRWPSSPKVDLITTDGFLQPNAWLEEHALMERKGFPESYNMPSLLKFLSAIKAGQAKVPAPLYSHLSYDVLPDQFQIVDRPDILIFEGINVLQSRDLPADGKIVPMVSDFFDFSIPSLVCRPLHAAEKNRFRRPEVLLPPLFGDYRRGGAGAGGASLEEHQPQEPAPEHPADPAAGGPHPQEGQGPSGRAGFAQETLTSGAWRAMRICRIP
jgi:type I pantothenate kinase